MTFNDIFKSSFLEKASSFSVMDFVLAMFVAFALGLFIFWVYKKTFHGVMYSAGFGVSLMAMAMITTFVILAVTSHVVLSLGMVGALSIVRFRTAVKEPMDIAFLFWAIGAGIVLGNRCGNCIGGGTASSCRVRLPVYRSGSLDFHEPENL